MSDLTHLRTFKLPPQYTPQCLVGQGTHGVVCAAKERRAGEGTHPSRRVAIKRIKPVACDAWDARHTLRELRLMRLLAPHPNVINLHNLVYAPADDSELYVVMELMDSDLHQIIQSKQELSEPHHKCLMLQLLLGVAALHDVGVLHRDLKPSNCLVSRVCVLRITDFGLARAAGADAFPGRNGEGSEGYYNAAGAHGPGGGVMTGYVARDM